MQLQHGETVKGIFQMSETTWKLKEILPKKIETTNFSEIVLIFCCKLQVHALGWYNFVEEQWNVNGIQKHVLAKEQWKWRYLHQDIDKY